MKIDILLRSSRRVLNPQLRSRVVVSNNHGHLPSGLQVRLLRDRKQQPKHRDALQLKGIRHKKGNKTKHSLAP